MPVQATGRESGSRPTPARSPKQFRSRVL
jgi:hypothetical protein